MYVGACVYYEAHISQTICRSQFSPTSLEASWQAPVPAEPARWHYFIFSFVLKDDLEAWY